METNPSQKTPIDNINDLAAYIREYGSVTFGQVCSKFRIASSTLYGWKKILLDTCSDITYANGIFHAAKTSDKSERERHK
jgi:hypothetical protein